MRRTTWIVDDRTSSAPREMVSPSGHVKLVVMAKISMWNRPSGIRVRGTWRVLRERLLLPAQGRQVCQVRFASVRLPAQECCPLLLCIRAKSELHAFQHPRSAPQAVQAAHHATLTVPNLPKASRAA
uniref:Uncharacterized protein n=1 Tax=Noctiluca scintillans TaxID=2966 RepID=A0A6T8W583_NOCSC|mmetsp:Transcript_26436/g.69487  ORF Transcript_26436/g.69487 Transcript_26436/m.69487 type:complete len:127 (+) Transcript_26436:393-773(+)